jgi:hypothetical protein
MKLEEYKWGNSSKNTVRESIDLADIKIVLLDHNNVIPRLEGYKNLLATDKLNNIIWIADLPEGSMYASYWSIQIDNNELYALSGSFLCKIDLKTGKVLSIQFVK